ncbi:MAG: fibrobacter succinogenes major paralogous domain-containing protein [Bacteroidales bacterium]|nr:fibrobacter succinogenes major paralogous domain-containing protein [Bacteroidales bacterium]
MKKISIKYLLISINILFLFSSLHSQIPQAIKYQAAIRDSIGNVLSNQALSIRISIIEDSLSGASVYTETHNTSTNMFGLVALSIGTGTVETGEFSTIDWGSSEFFVKTEIDTSAGSNFQELGLSKLLSVPYALETGIASSLTLIDENGNYYDIIIDTAGNLIANPEWVCGQPLIDTRDGQTYNTVLIGTQCWMAENLNIGTRIDGINEQTDNSVIEKYCYNDDVTKCDTFGGLYQWDEMMQYVLDTGAQGICPNGWYIPSDEEWKILEGTVDSQYGVGDPEWDYLNAWRGFDAGKNLKSTSGWYNNGNGTDTFGFSALPGGIRSYYLNFINLGEYAGFWTSTGKYSSTAWKRNLVGNHDEINRHHDNKEYGRSVRCIKD